MPIHKMLLLSLLISSALVTVWASLDFLFGGVPVNYGSILFASWGSAFAGMMTAK